MPQLSHHAVQKQNNEAKMMKQLTVKKLLSTNFPVLLKQTFKMSIHIIISVVDCWKQVVAEKCKGRVAAKFILLS